MCAYLWFLFKFKYYPQTHIQHIISISLYFDVCKLYECVIAKVWKMFYSLNKQIVTNNKRSLLKKNGNAHLLWNCQDCGRSLGQQTYICVCEQLPAFRFISHMNTQWAIYVAKKKCNPKMFITVTELRKHTQHIIKRLLYIIIESK